MGIKNEEFYADFRSVKMIAKKRQQKTGMSKKVS